MARRNPLAMLVGIAAVAGAVASVVRESCARREPRVVRRPLTEAEVVGLAEARSAISLELPTAFPGLDPETAARIAMAYPACWALSERNH